MTASPDRIRDLLNRHWDASGAGDQDAEHDIQAIRTHHPARRTFNVRKITGAGDTWVTEYLLTYDGAPTYTVSIMQFSGDHVTRETQYFADPFGPPAWRSRWTEQRQPAAGHQG